MDPITWPAAFDPDSASIRATPKSKAEPAARPVMVFPSATTPGEGCTRAPASWPHQRRHPGVGPQVLHAHAAAGQDDHLRPVQVHLVQGQVGLYRDAVPAGDQLPLQGGQGRLHPRPAKQVGGHQGFRLLKAGGQQNIHHNCFLQSYQRAPYRERKAKNRCPK